MQTTTTGRMSTAVKSGVQALESRMPEKRACPVWRRGRRKRVARYLAGGLPYLVHTCDDWINSVARMN